MATFLFDDIIFGPITSRRLGASLGINLLPTHAKLCNFNCIYCECGWTPGKGDLHAEFHPAAVVIERLAHTLQEIKEASETLDTITFAGNGEPTLHPHFQHIVEATVNWRNTLFPQAVIAVLTNGTMLHKPAVFNALNQVEQNILKLDSALPETLQLIDQPLGHYDLQKVIKQYQAFQGQLIIQTLFLRGTYQGQVVDNTTEEELQAWLKALQLIKPKEVMIYTIARDTPVDTLEKVPLNELQAIASQVETLGIPTQVSG